MFLELELNIKFPTCWDGVNTEAQNGNPHVIYSPDCDPNHDNECFDHSCPNSHPQKGFIMRNIETKLLLPNGCLKLHNRNKLNAFNPCCIFFDIYKWILRFLRSTFMSESRTTKEDRTSSLTGPT